jgi:hypothetical protein
VENLPPQYYSRMQAGKDEEWIKVYVHGEYGFVSDGRPVYPEYSDHTHTASEILEPLQGHTIYVGIDFGLTPAALFAQSVNGRWNIIDELVADDMGAVRFGDELGRILRGKYAGFEFEIWGDPAGEQRAQTNEETPFQILQAKGINAQPAPFPGMDNDFTIRREAVATNLTRLCMDGRPAVQVSPNCRMFRKGMAGAYRYKRVQISGDERYHDKPDKTMYSHVCEAGQYLFVGAGEGDKLVGAETKGWDEPLKQDMSYIV